MPDPKQRKLILVTGSPRSGTTVVGTMLSLGRDTCAMHEPFNFLVGMRQVQQYFEISGAGGCDAGKLNSCVQQIATLQVRYKPGVFPRETGLRRMAKHLFGGRARQSQIRCRANPFLKTIVWKDPFGCFVADEVSRSHDMPVVVTVRNPFAVAASFKRMDWAFDIDDIYQRLGIDVGDSAFPGTRAWQARREPVANAVLLWRAIYSHLLERSITNDRILFVDLDDIVAEPVATYRNLYGILELTWNDRIERKINSAYQVRSGPDVPKGQKAHDSARDLSAVNRYWSAVLSADEQDIVRDTASQVWEQFAERSSL